MNRINIAAVLFATFVAGIFFSRYLPALAASEKIVTAAQVNGTWKAKNGTFKILALGKQRLKVEFSGIYEYSSSYGPMANTGDASGIAIIEGDTAIFKPEGVENDCRITLVFSKGKLNVVQESFCGFGNHVTASGIYQKISDRKPKFQES
jgi:hypothetical protein